MTVLNVDTATLEGIEALLLPLGRGQDRMASKPNVRLSSLAGKTPSQR
jgi:hypothetical protein